MRISPLDIRKQTFKKTMRGADPEEVRVFLELVGAEYEKVLQENAMMAERMRHQEERLSEYADLEKGLRNALVTADRIASESRSASEREAQRVLQDASIRAERILEGARERLQGLIREIEALRGKREAFLRRFLTLIQSQIGVVAEHAQDLDEVDSMRRQVEALMTDSRVSFPDQDEEGLDRATTADRAENQIEDDDPHSGTRGGSDDLQWVGRGVRPETAGSLRGQGVRHDDGQDPPRRGLTEHELPRGLGRLLRGRQARLPLDVEPALLDDDSAGEAEASDQDSKPFFPIRQRREGFFEISATEDQERIRQQQD